ncbi:AAA family ATPase [Tardiphaga sp. OK245]|uniref:bifunctional aminoglycoside phosphotransferase/ATP-binding protein n=1 Tax=Tardiphaga sp. OK245 TaxID=1855306 RepID=UPI0008A7B427|nr:AAA family ATPase [Tardiphaga sp. OK245]SEI19543.1 hypothetical protein SAMN05216367_4894 [Tardiphaga sp. OK245]
MTNDQDKSSESSAQDVIVAFLGSIEPGIKRIDTHASIVFLGAERVWKIKRAVRLPFLDYSSLEKRRAACEAELDVNKSFAPDLYRRVVPITDGSDGLAVDGQGTPVEWAVEMKRFDETAGLDRIAATVGIAPALAEEVADAILASHHRSKAADGAAWLASIGTLIARNTARFREVNGLERQAVEKLHSSSLAALDAQRPCLERRAAEGFVRRCHGDLHLGNITMIDGKPVLFDAIEFDPAIATTDVLYDLSFALMDMLHHEQRTAANVSFNRYLARSAPVHLDALALFPLFLSIRAAIRAHVLFMKAEQNDSNRQVGDEAGKYFELAVQLINPPPGGLVAVGGMSGTGKSVLARAVAPFLGPAPGAVVLRSDVVRKAMFDFPEHHRLPEFAYAPRVTQRVYDALMMQAHGVASQGHGVVIDAAFLRPEERCAFAGIEPASSVHLGLFLRADLNVRLARIAGRHNDASDATATVAHMQESLDSGNMDWPVIDAGGTPEATRAKVMPYLAPLIAQCAYDP